MPNRCSNKTIDDVLAGRSGAMLEATAATSVDRAHEFARRTLMEKDGEGRVRVYQDGPWLHIVSELTARVGPRIGAA